MGNDPAPAHAHRPYHQTGKTQEAHRHVFLREADQERHHLRMAYARTRNRLAKGRRISRTRVRRNLELTMTVGTKHTPTNKHKPTTRHTEQQTNSKTNKQTNQQTNKQTNNQPNKQTHQAASTKPKRPRENMQGTKNNHARRSMTALDSPRGNT